MLFTRDIGGILRGSASRPQILLGCALGGILGFIPGSFLPSDLGGGFMQAPGLIVTVIALAFILNTSMAVFGLSTLAAKLLSFLMLPVSVAVGEFFLDGPTSGLFEWLVNAPVTAWFGFERYATTGGVFVGLAFGIVLGLLLWNAVHSARVKAAQLDEGSDKWKNFTSKRSTRFVAWLFLGGTKKGKKSWADLAEHDREGRPIRIAGLVAVVILSGVLWFVHERFAEKWFADSARVGLTDWNGSTVDVDHALCDLSEGLVEIKGLAISDYRKLDTDAFRADEITLNVDTGALLSGLVIVDELTCAGAVSGAARAEPAKRIGDGSGGGGTEPPIPPPPPGDGKTIDDYIAEAEEWRDRLQSMLEWIERFSGDDSDETEAEREKRLEEEKELNGWVALIADHLLSERPDVLVRQVRFEGVEALQLDRTAIDIIGSNLSSRPSALKDPAELNVTARNGAFACRLTWGAGVQPTVECDIPGLSIAGLKGSLVDLPLSDGTIDLKVGGVVDLANGGEVDFPLQIKLNDTAVQLEGRNVSLDGLGLAIGLRGPLSNPRISLDDDALVQALEQAGRREAANFIRDNASKLLGDQLSGLGDGAAKIIESGDTEAAVDAAKKLVEDAAGGELIKKLPGGLGGLFGGSKKSSGENKKKGDPDKR